MLYCRYFRRQEMQIFYKKIVFSNYVYLVTPDIILRIYMRVREKQNSKLIILHEINVQNQKVEIAQFPPSAMTFHTD